MTDEITLPRHELLAGADLLAEAAQFFHDHDVPTFFEPWCRLALAWYQRYAPDDPALMSLLKWFAPILHERQRTAAAQDAEQWMQRIALLWRAHQYACEHLLHSLCAARPGAPLSAEQHGPLVQALGMAVRDCTQTVREQRQPLAPQARALARTLVDEVLAEPLGQPPQALSPVASATTIAQALRATRQLLLHLLTLPQPLPPEDDALVGEAVRAVILHALDGAGDPRVDAGLTDEERG